MFTEHTLFYKQIYTSPIRKELSLKLFYQGVRKPEGKVRIFQNQICSIRIIVM